MTYNQYLNFYGLDNTEESKAAWLSNEHRKGNLYKYDNKYYSTETGEEVK